MMKTHKSKLLNLILKHQGNEDDDYSNGRDIVEKHMDDSSEKVMRPIYTSSDLEYIQVNNANIEPTKSKAKTNLPTDMARRIMELEAERDRMASKWIEAEMNLHMLTVSLQESHAALAEQESDLINTKQSLKEMTFERDSLSNKIGALEADLAVVAGKCQKFDPNNLLVPAEARTSTLLGNMMEETRRGIEELQTYYKEKIEAYQEDISTLHDIIELDEHSLTSLRNGISEYQTTVATYEQRLKEENLAVSKLNAEVDQKRSSEKELKEKKKELEMKIRSLEDDLKMKLELEHEHEEQAKELQAAAAELNDCKLQMGDLRKDNLKLMKENDNLQRILHEMRTELVEENELMVNPGTKSSTMVINESHKSHAADDMYWLLNETKKIRKMLRSCQKEKIGLEEQFGDACRDLEFARNRTAVLEKQIEAMGEELLTARRTISVQEESINDLTSSAQSASAKIQQLEQKQRKEPSEKNLDHLERFHVGNQREMEDLIKTSQVAALGAAVQIVQLYEKLKSYNAQKELLEKELMTVRTDLDSAEKELLRSQITISGLSTELQNYQTELTSSVSIFEKEKLSLEQQIHAKDMELAQAVVLIQKHDEQIRDLLPYKSIVKALTEELQYYRRTHEIATAKMGELSVSLGALREEKIELEKMNEKMYEELSGTKLLIGLPEDRIAELSNFIASSSIANTQMLEQELKRYSESNVDHLHATSRVKGGADGKSRVSDALGEILDQQLVMMKSVFGNLEKELMGAVDVLEKSKLELEQEIQNKDSELAQAKEKIQAHEDSISRLVFSLQSSQSKTRRLEQKLNLQKDEYAAKLYMVEDKYKEYQRLHLNTTSKMGELIASLHELEEQNKSSEEEVASAEMLIALHESRIKELITSLESEMSKNQHLEKILRNHSGEQITQLSETEDGCRSD